MSPHDAVIPPQDDTFEPGGAPVSGNEFDALPEEDRTEAELWEALSDRVPAPFIAGSYAAETLQSNLSAVGMASADDMQSNLSAVGVAKTDWFESIGSVVCAAIVEGDAEVSTSAVPLLIAKGDVDFHQAYASACVAGGTVRVHQGGSPLMIAKKLKVEQGGGMVMIAGEAKVKRGFVGVLFAREAAVSEDSRVLVTGKAATIISAAVFGGLALMAMAVFGGLLGKHGRYHR